MDGLLILDQDVPGLDQHLLERGIFCRFHAHFPFSFAVLQNQQMLNTKSNFWREDSKWPFRRVPQFGPKSFSSCQHP